MTQTTERKIDAETAWDLPYTGNEAFAHVATIPGDHTRWSVWSTIVVRDTETDELWGYELEKPATEQQEVYRPEEFVLRRMKEIKTVTWEYADG